MQSCLYEGKVSHRRNTPRHQFHYRLFLAYIDLDELDEIFQGRLFWSTNRWAVARFRREDHLGDPQQSLKQSVRDLISEQLDFIPTGPIRLLTHLRYWGFVMNPVSFYFCYDDQEQLQVIVAEVNNTPWGEQHCYVLDLRGQSADSKESSNCKEFHVSPFMGMEMDYRWRIEPPDREVRISIENLEQGKPVFHADLHLARQEITSWSLARLLMLYPWMTLKVFVAIYWQALLLWWKGCRYYPHPAASNLNARQRKAAT